jgi:hypothetical protein
MTQYWEDKFAAWAKPPSDSEIQRCENARLAVRKAIDQSLKLSQRNIKVFSQGSYRNNTNIRQESDVDIGVLCYDTFFPAYPEGTTHQTFGNTDATYHYQQYKNEIEEALVAYFGSKIVHRGNKAFDVEETSYHSEIDVAPFFEHRRYSNSGTYLSGVELQPDNGQPPKVINWPEQHYENGVAKNNATSRRYKAAARIIKNIKNEMSESGIAVPASIIGFLIECLTLCGRGSGRGGNWWADSDWRRS